MRFGWLQVVRRVMLTFLLLLAGAAMAFGLAELTIRLAAPQQLIVFRPDIWRPVDSLGWAHRANLDTRVNTGDRTVTLTTDSAGFRTGESGRPAGDRRVLLLGDSFMEALQVEHEQSLAGLVEQCFGARTGRRAAVWNTAVGGWGPPQYSIQAQHALSTTRFDLVVVGVFLGNDVVTRRYVLPPREPDPRRVLRFPRALTWSAFTGAVLAPVNDGLETRSHLFIFLKDRLQGLLMRAGLTALEIPAELWRDQAAAPRWALTGAILADIDSLAAARRIPVVYALIPSIEQVDAAALTLRLEAFGVDPASLDLDQPDRLLASELAKRGLTSVSLLGPFREAHSRGVRLYGRADPHLSAAGHSVTWNQLAPVMARALGAPYRPTSAPAGECDAP